MEEACNPAKGLDLTKTSPFISGLELALYMSLSTGKPDISSDEQSLHSPMEDLQVKSLGFAGVLLIALRECSGRN